MGEKEEESKERLKKYIKEIKNRWGPYWKGGVWSWEEKKRSQKKGSKSTLVVRKTWRLYWKGEVWSWEEKKGRQKKGWKSTPTKLKKCENHIEKVWSMKLEKEEEK